MIISEDTQKVVDYLKDYSNSTLRKANDLASILELGASLNFSDLVNDLIFTGKSIWNMHYSITSQRNSGVFSQNLSQIESELKKSLSLLQEYLKEITENADEDLKDRFDNVYLEETRGCFRNLIDLSHDLAIFKQLQSDTIRNKKD